MSAPRSYVITLGVAQPPRRGGRHVVRSGRATIVYATSSRGPGAHRAGRTARRGHVAVDPTYAPGRHRVVPTRSARVLRTALPTVLILAAAALFLTAWFSASDAVAF
ncbi:MAG TPA: hypothetical protein VGF84_05005, partial [Micromonosporaceae bacterium]